VWTGPKVDVESTHAISPDGRYLSFVDWDTGDLALHDLTSGVENLLRMVECFAILILELEVSRNPFLVEQAEGFFVSRLKVSDHQVHGGNRRGRWVWGFRVCGEESGKDPG